MVTICVVLCGLAKTLDTTVDTYRNYFADFKVDFYVCSNYDYLKYNYTCQNISKIILVPDESDIYRNSINYANKICNGIKNIDIHNAYDFYIISRSDLHLIDIDLSIINNTHLHFSDINMNQFIHDIDGKINDNFIITKNYEELIKLVSLYQYTKTHNNYLDIAMFNYLSSHNILYCIMPMSYKLILSKCNLIAISGDSGSGKSTLSNTLKLLFNENELLTLETDRYHNWERGDKNYNIYSHLHPNANNLEKMNEDIYNLKLGNEIYQVDYDHDTGKFTSKQCIHPKDNIILCGLHTLYQNQLIDQIDIKIYLDTDRELLKKWKINRDVAERGYDFESVLNQINHREKDYWSYIECQKNNANIIIYFYEQCDELRAKFIINKFNTILLSYVIKFKYNITSINDRVEIELKTHIDFVTDNVQLNRIIDENIFLNIYYKQIFIFMYLIIYG